MNGEYSARGDSRQGVTAPVLNMGLAQEGEALAKLLSVRRATQDLRRDIALHDILAALEEWPQTHGAERQWWRDHARERIAAYRAIRRVDLKRYAETIARSKQQREAA